MVSSEQRIALALQTCLESIQTGQDSFETALARYPELEADLRPQLEDALWLIARRPLVEPDPDFVRRSHARLMARIQAEQRAAVNNGNGAHASASLPARDHRSPGGHTHRADDGMRRPPPPIPGPAAWLGNLLAMLRLSPALARAAVTMAVILVLLLGADRLVENTQAAIPGEAGYTIKRTVEDLALAVTTDPGQDVVLNLEYSQRRLSETALLLQNRRYQDASTTLGEFEEHVRGAVASLGEIQDRDTVHKELLAMTMQEKLSNNTDQLASLLPRAPETVKPSVTRAILVSNSGMAVAATAIERLMTMQTPTPADLLQTPTPGGLTSGELITPTEATILSIFSTPTEEFRQIFSSTASGPVTDPTRRPDDPVLPTAPPPAATATPLPTYSEDLPTEIPTQPLPTRTPTRTPIPRTPTPQDTPTPVNQNNNADSPTPTSSAQPN